MVLGFDASTTCAGWAFYDGKEIMDAGFIKIDKFETNKEKAFHIISVLDANQYIPVTDHINLEAALSGFMGGQTRQQTIIKLAKFNAVFEYIISEYWNLPVYSISASSARKKVFGKCYVKGINSKEYVKSKLSSIMNLSKFDKYNSKNNWDIHNFDMYDAIVQAMYN